MWQATLDPQGEVLGYLAKMWQSHNNKILPRGSKLVVGMPDDDDLINSSQ